MVEVEQNTDNTGTFTDPRDGQTYKTVKIGSQIWMAENLNYEFLGSYSVEGDTENNKKYGRLYTRKVAKVARPDGWHIPSKEEWDALEEFVADILFRGDKDYVGYALKAKDCWEFDDNGTDAVGFGALPAGYHSRSNPFSFGSVYSSAYFWSSTEDDAMDAYAYYRRLRCCDLALAADNCNKDDALSVRCVKDS